MFSRAFSSQVQPVEIARKLAKEMDAHRTASVSRVYVPNQYTVCLSTEDRKRLEGYERSLEQELSAYLLEHARRHDYALLTRPEVKLETRRAPAPGRVRDPDAAGQAAARQGEEPAQGEQGHTMVYTVPPKQQKSRGASPAAHLTETKAIVSLDDRRYVLDGPVAVLGRSRECDCVLNDPNVSRQHAELRRGSTGDWQIVDLGLDQRRQGQRPPGRLLAPAPGDEVTIGTSSFIFDIEQ